MDLEQEEEIQGENFRKNLEKLNGDIDPNKSY